MSSRDLFDESFVELPAAVLDVAHLQSPIVKTFTDSARNRTFMCFMAFHPEVDWTPKSAGKVECLP